MTSSIRATHGLLVVMLATVPMSAVRATPPLIVVEDRGGASALPYYEALDLQPRATSQPLPSIVIPEAPTAAVDETAMLPVRSARLTPGPVARRVLEAPGLRALGTTRDRIGREVIGLGGIPSSPSNADVTLLISAGTGRIVGFESALVEANTDLDLPPGSLTEYALWDVRDREDAPR